MNRPPDMVHPGRKAVANHSTVVNQRYARSLANRRRKGRGPQSHLLRPAYRQHYGNIKWESK